jgi:hypothetical protein
MIFAFSLVSSAVMNPDFSTEENQKWLQWYVISAGGFGLASLIMMLFFKYLQVERQS